ncbi:MAG: hypothetical protein L3J26_01470 [Candidatus Polarisedimenticolaceae bacterium]|nr:hypothetical protein [Candidatus Polarisedimenticolaceae bacterium]
MAQKIWMGVTAFILVAVVGVGGLQIWQQVPKDIVATAALDSRCDLQEAACESHFPDGGRVVFSIMPHPIVGLKPLQLKVQIESLQAQGVAVDFRGLGMNMGFNRPQLQRDAEGEYSGMGTLAVCVVDRMVWEATVLITTRDGVYAAPFRFETVRH